MTSTRLFDPAIEICDILSTATSKQIPNSKTTKKRQPNNTVNKLRQGKLRETTKFLLTRFS